MSPSVAETYLRWCFIGACGMAILGLVTLNIVLVISGILVAILIAAISD